MAAPSSNATCKLAVDASTLGASDTLTSRAGSGDPSGSESQLVLGRKRRSAAILDRVTLFKKFTFEIWRLCHGSLGLFGSPVTARPDSVGVATR